MEQSNTENFSTWDSLDLGNLYMSRFDSVQKGLMEEGQLEPVVKALSKKSVKERLSVYVDIQSMIEGCLIEDAYKTAGRIKEMKEHFHRHVL